MNKESPHSPSAAFTLIELLTVVAVLVLLACIAAPILARAKTKSPAVGCLSNLRQLQAGWAMYSDDNSGVLMPNAPTSASSTNVWCAGAVGWGVLSANTNPILYQISIMAHYVSSNLTIYRCPADIVPSQNGTRLRSYSMNGQMGAPYSASTFNSGWRSYTNEADLVCPSPKDAFVFCDEHPSSINDGLFIPSLNSPQYIDLPASYLEGGCGFSFADGHGEIHKWRSRFVLVPVVANQTPNFPILSSGTDLDWLWLRDHSSCH
jgi:prepilin-type N-terminal cleavage/methylation domain-containing protein